MEKTDEEPKFLVSLTSAPAKRMKVLVPVIADVIIVEMLTISAKQAEEKMEWMKLLSTKVARVVSRWQSKIEMSVCCKRYWMYKSL